jgi:dTDP-4-dehydrorhamnose 3,5-epimerase
LSYTVTQSELSGVLVLTPKVFEDERGFFLESFNQLDFVQVTGIDVNFVQDNHSQSRRGVLRGLHYQIEQPQGKLVRVTRGEVLDVAVNLQFGHPELGKWTSVHLSEKNKKQVWIPPGFAHGFLVLSDFADFLYKTTDFYLPTAERCLAWNDPQVGIEWPTDVEIIITSKDRDGSFLGAADLFHFI